MAGNNKPTGLIAKKGIELLTFGTPNGHKVSILLEELKDAYGMEYTCQSIDLFQDVQKEPWFTKISPNGRIPVIVDHDKGDYTVMEGLAILNYLVRHYDPEHKFSFEDPLDACTAEQWLAWHHGGLGPIQAQANFFYRFSPDRHGFPTQRFVGETERFYAVLETRLANRDYVAGSGRGKYSITDMAIWPFINACAVTGIELERFPHMYKWWERVGERSAVKKGMCVPGGMQFPFGYEKMRRMREEEPVGMEEREKPLRDALVNARREVGSV